MCPILRVYFLLEYRLCSDLDIAVMMGTREE